MDILRRGMAFIIQGIFSDATLLEASTHQQCFRILGEQTVDIIICEGKISERLNLELIRQAKSVQPRIKVVVLLEESTIDCCIPKNIPVEQIQRAILEIMPSEGVLPGNI